MSGYQQLGRDAPKELGDDAVWKSKMNKRKLLSVVLGAAVVCLNFIFPVFAVSANGSDGNCPAVWHNYVDAVRKMDNSLRENAIIVFVNRDGVAFDCLDKGFSEKILQRISQLEGSLPIDRMVLLGDSASTWPVNICAVGTGGPRLNYISISLPTEQHILALQACSRSVSGGLERALKK